MREETKIIKIYTFDELSEEAKERAINKEREITLDYEWWEWILEDLTEQCKELGVYFKTDDLTFDLNRGAYLAIYSDKLSFEWEAEIDLPCKFGAYQNYMGGGINGRIQSEFIDDFRITNLGKGEKKASIADRLNKCLTIFERTLESLWREYKEVQSDEYLIDNIKENELEYTKEGDVYYG